MTTSPLQVPAEPLFPELLKYWQQTPKKTLIRDLSASASHPEASVERFLYDVLTLRIQLWGRFNEHTKQALQDPNADNVYIAVLASPGYETAVLCYAIYSVGAVIVPLCVSGPANPALLLAVLTR